MAAQFDEERDVSVPVAERAGERTARRRDREPTQQSALAAARLTTKQHQALVLQSRLNADRPGSGFVTPLADGNGSRHFGSTTGAARVGDVQADVGDAEGR